MAEGTNVGQIYYDVLLDTSKLVQGSRAVSTEVDKAASSFNRITDAIKVLSVAISILKIAQLADDMRLLQARVDVATGSVQAGADAMGQLVAISNRTQTAVAGNVQVFTRLNSSIRQMGGTAADTLRITDLLAKAITVSGAAAEEKRAAMLQFGQALGSGVLQGDEFRSLMENAPYLMQQLATSLGVPIGELKALSTQGKLTAGAIVEALGAAADRINADFAKFPKTVSGALQLAEDASKRANEELDKLVGTSAALAGIGTGLAQTLDGVAAAIKAMGEQASGLDRSERIKTWAERARLVLSYVADAADVTWQTLSVLGRNVSFVFESVGKEIGGIRAQVMAVLRGDFGGARAIGAAMRKDSAARRAALDAADARTLADRKTWGEQMRATWEQARGEDRGFTPSTGGSKLTSTPNSKLVADQAARRAAAQAYLDGLLVDTKTGLEKINIEEQKASEENTRRQQQDRAAGMANDDIYQKARVAIIAKYARERLLLEERTAQEVAALSIAITIDDTAKIEATRAEAFRHSDAEVQLGVKTFAEGERAKVLAAFQAAEAMKALDTKRFGTIEGTLQIKAHGGDQKAQEDLIDAQMVLALRANEEARKSDLANWQIYADREVAIIQDRNLRLAALREQRVQSELAGQALLLGSAAGFFDQLAQLQQQNAGQQSASYRAAFALSKAFAIAQGTVALYSAALKAMDDPTAITLPQKLANYAAVFAAGGSLLAAIKGATYGGGRQYGGPAESGSLYRVNEAGRPEMFTASNGAQYMLPTKSGSVTAADKAGGGASWTLVINEVPAGMRFSQPSVDSETRTVRLAVAEVARQFANNEGPAYQGLRQGTNIKPRL